MALACVTVIAVTMMVLTAMMNVANAQWVNMNGLAASYDASRNSVLSVGHEYSTGTVVAFVDNDDPVYNLGGDYRLVVDGRYVTLTGVNAGGAWVCAEILDSDVKTAVNMLKNGSQVKLQFCSSYLNGCKTIFSSGLKDSARTINNVIL